MNEELSVLDKPGELAPVHDESLRDISTKVKAYMDRKERKIQFGGKPYPEFDDYQFAASFFGWRVVTESEPVTIADQSGFKGKARVVDKSGVEVGAADSYCFNTEPNWRNKPLFQLGSMAQTRAGSKALANILRPVFKLAGYETTPAEEMTGETRTVQKPQSRSLPAINSGTHPSSEPPEDNTENGMDFPAQDEPPTRVFGDPAKKISEKQGKMLYAIYKKAGITDEKMKNSIKMFFGLEHSRDLTNAQLSQILELIGKGAIK